MDAFYREVDAAMGAIEAPRWRRLRLPVPTWRGWAAVLLPALAAWWSFPRLAQPQSYHHFADDRTRFGIPRFGDVITNVPFAVVAWIAIRGMSTMEHDKTRFRTAGEALMYRSFFAALGSVALGSGIYHLAPANGTLFLDRLTMTLAYGALVPICMAERISPAAGLRAWLPVMALAAASATAWIASELLGSGHLLPYALLQGGILAAWGGLMAARSSAYTGAWRQWAAFALGVACKAIEVFDKPVYLATLRTISGHSLHHLLAAAAGWMLWRHVAERRALRGSAAAEATQNGSGSGLGYAAQAHEAIRSAT